ncbi:carboxypeptidase regulatory-like domain-containing protein [Paraburkholderia sacchari]|uniref:carboxypeptidase regulatory-like domain-containing protein n=1 Tax=Paraburkholderia sacchari TaxID=159450 RepID=UPI003D965746
MKAFARSLLGGLLCLVSIVSPVPAQTHIAPVTRNGIEYVSGGIGADEVHAIQALAPQYNLRITFALTGGEYLSDVTVTLKSERGVELLKARTHGPLIFFRVPPGRYRVAAQAGHVIEHRWVRVPAKGGIDTRFYWPEPNRHGVVTSL